MVGDDKDIRDSLLDPMVEPKVLSVAVQGLEKKGVQKVGREPPGLKEVCPLSHSLAAYFEAHICV